jgi:hypothetical protein
MSSLRKGLKFWTLSAITADPLATRNTILFAALTALGIPPLPELCGEFVENVNGRPRSVTVWRMADRSIDGRYQTAEMIQAWEDKDFSRKNPEHPLAYIMCAFENHTRSIEFVKDQGPIAVIRRNGKIGLITKHTSPEHKRQIIDGLNQEAEIAG